MWRSWLARQIVALEAEGSNPSTHLVVPFLIYIYGGIAQLARAHGSYPWCRRFKSYSRYLHGILAQLGEHLPYKQRVTGSSPVGPILLKDINQYGEVAQLARASGSYPGG